MSIQKAVDYFGNESRLARAIGVKQPTVWAWNKKGTPPPIIRCVQIEKLTGGAVNRKDLRPDDWHLNLAGIGRRPTQIKSPSGQMLIDITELKRKSSAIYRKGKK